MKVGQQDLADVFRVSVRTIQRWEKRGLDRARVGNGATYDLPEAVAWALEREQASEDTDYETARARRMAADAHLRELELGRERGTLVHIDDMEDLLRTPLERVAAELKAAPSRLAPELAARAGISHAAALAILKAIVEEARAALRSVGDEK